MVHQLAKKVKNKHLIIIGGKKVDRHNLINGVVQEANLQTFIFPKEMETIDQYLTTVRKEKMFNAWYEQKRQFGSNQLLDFHRDWLMENNSLIILEEFQHMNQSWQIDLLKTFFEAHDHRTKGSCGAHLIVTFKSENSILEELAEMIFVPSQEKRTRIQLIRGCFET